MDLVHWPFLHFSPSTLVEKVRKTWLRCGAEEGNGYLLVFINQPFAVIQTKIPK